MKPGPSGDCLRTWSYTRSWSQAGETSWCVGSESLDCTSGVHNTSAEVEAADAWVWKLSLCHTHSVVAAAELRGRMTDSLKPCHRVGFWIDGSKLGIFSGLFFVGINIWRKREGSSLGWHLFGCCTVLREVLANPTGRFETQTAWVGAKRCGFYVPVHTVTGRELHWAVPSTLGRTQVVWEQKAICW